MSAQAALPGDATQGKRLYDASCRSCHDAGVYTRKERRVNSLEALRNQINGCAHMTQQNISDTNQRDLVKYLNETFYKF